MNRKTLLGITRLFAATTVATLSGTSHAASQRGAQICSLGSAGVGQMGSVICKDVATGATTQVVPVGATVVAGGTGGTLSRGDGRVLVTNVAGGAVLFREVNGWLRSPVLLQTGGESSLSGAIGGHGAYVLTATRLLFFPEGRTQPRSGEPLLKGDGSAAQVAVARDYAYVSEKSGSLEGFPLAHDGSLMRPAAPVAGVPAGVIVGITISDDLAVAPVAHLASDFNQSTVPVAGGLGVVQTVPTKEVAACWAAAEDHEVCVTNPGSMTVSCGRTGPGGFKSYTSAAAMVSGDTLLDIDVSRHMVGIPGIEGGVPMALGYTRSEEGSDFLTLAAKFPLGTAKATGALVLPPTAR